MNYFYWALIVLLHSSTWMLTDIRRTITCCDGRNTSSFIRQHNIYNTDTMHGPVKQRYELK